MQRSRWRIHPVLLAVVVALSALLVPSPARSATLSEGPTILSAKAGNHQVALSWTPVAPRGSVAPSYVVFSNPENVSCRTSALTCVLAPLRNGQPYDLVVRVLFGAVVGSTSQPVSVTPAAVPGPPTYVVATAGDTQATLHWQEPHGDGGLPITQYRATATPGGASCTTTSATSCIIAGLTHGQKYTVQVRARNAMGESAPSSASPAVLAGLAPVTSVAAEVTSGPAGLGSATISWTKIPRPLVTYVALSSDGKSTCAVVDATSCTARINGLQPVSFTVTGHTTTSFGLPLSTLPSAPSSVLAVRVVVLLAGQSNATGSAAPGTDFPSSPLSTPADQQAHLVWDPFDYLPAPRSGWLPLSAPQQAKGAVSPSFGPEVGLARTVFAETHLPLSVVKVTYGGTGLARGWTPSRPNGLFAEMIRFTTRRLVADQAAGTIDVLRGFVWFQGENDALSLSDAVNYLGNLTTFLTAVRSALPFASGATTVLIAESSAASIAKRLSLGFCGDPTCRDEQLADALVRSADRQVAASLTGISVVDSLGYARGDDAVHLTAASELAIGEATARALGPALGLPQGP